MSHIYIICKSELCLFSFFSLHIVSSVNIKHVGDAGVGHHNTLALHKWMLLPAKHACVAESL